MRRVQSLSACSALLRDQNEILPQQDLVGAKHLPPPQAAAAAAARSREREPALRHADAGRVEQGVTRKVSKPWLE